jgi:hypothetical protein
VTVWPGLGRPTEVTGATGVAGVTDGVGVPVGDGVGLGRSSGVSSGRITVRSRFTDVRPKPPTVIASIATGRPARSPLVATWMRDAASGSG